MSKVVSFQLSFTKDKANLIKFINIIHKNSDSTQVC